MEDAKFMIKCDLCSMPFRFGPHKYDGKFLSKYNMSVCHGCLKAHWDGVGPSHEEQFIKHLEKNIIHPPEKNSKGWYPLE